MWQLAVFTTQITLNSLNIHNFIICSYLNSSHSNNKGLVDSKGYLFSRNLLHHMRQHLEMALEENMTLSAKDVTVLSELSTFQQIAVKTLTP